jgi:acyl-CoA reductase-like NAD-dependent aldehyde dehydrogenase
VSQLSQAQIELIATRVFDLMQDRDTHGKTHSTAADEDAIPENGIFHDIDSAVRAARRAQKELMSLSLQTREKILDNIRSKMMVHAEELAAMAHEETSLGRTEHKVFKNRLVVEKTPGTEILTPQAFSGDRGLTLMELAPYGVIGAITPSTNPTSTISCNTIGMLAAGNSVVFNAHPAAKNCSKYNIILLNQAIIEAGGPKGLINTVAQPTIETAQALMQHDGIRLLVVTGGAGVVKAAMTSGKRAICAGPGNPPVVVDESADIDNAAKCIIEGAAMDNNIICVDEKEVFVVDEVANKLFRAFAGHDAILLNIEQVQQLEKVIFSELKGPRKAAVMEKTLIGKNIQDILSKIGIQVEDKVRLAIAPVDEDHPLVWTEQMMPVIPVVRVANADKAIDLAKEAEHGFGHTAIMHSKNLDNLSRMAKEMNCSIFVKNGPSYSGLGYGGEGYCSFSIASPTGEGLTTAKSFSRERRCVLVDHFRIV